MPYRRKSRRTFRPSGRDYFWAIPVQAVESGASDKGWLNVDRPGFTLDDKATTNWVNLTNDLTQILPRHGATTIRWDYQREMMPRDREWRIHYFQGQLIMVLAGGSAGHHVIAGQMDMGPGMWIPRTEGSNVPSNTIRETSYSVHTEYFAADGQLAGNVYDSGQLMAIKSYKRLRMALTLRPQQSFYVNVSIDHAEGGASKAQFLIHGRFRCSRA